MKFRAPPDGVLRHVRLDAMTAVYDRRSGATHLVADVVPTILDALGEGEVDVDTLFKRLFGSNPATTRLPEPVEGLPFARTAQEDQAFDKLRQAEGGDRSALADRLAELVSIGLIEAI